ncbi:MAG: DUF3027 domain-containing protein [Bifidobacteriaceae bacterium]|nr:DUF3027 domain-containing protein [Bifidobacteriaceae bacterium]
MTDFTEATNADSMQELPNDGEATETTVPQADSATETTETAGDDAAPDASVNDGESRVGYKDTEDFNDTEDAAESTAGSSDSAGSDASAAENGGDADVTVADEDADGIEGDDDSLPKVDPRDLALNVAFRVAEDETEVGNFIEEIPMEDGVTDFRFQAAVPGYEHWQWSVTLFHDVGRDTWTVCESSLIPAEGAMLAPQWVPWKDRLEPSDLSPTDSIGTEEDDPRLEDGYRTEETHAIIPGGDAAGDAGKGAKDAAAAQDATDGSATATVGSVEAGQSESSEAGESDAAQSTAAQGEATQTGAVQDGAAATDARQTSADQVEADETDQTEDIVDEFELGRRRVMSPLGRSQAAERWYDGPHGPKALSTRTAAGKICETCGFFVPIKGELGRIFGVCANKWSPDDGRVVSRDHGCGEHSEIAPPAPTPMWIQTEPALDDNTIEIIRQSKRDEIGVVEAMEGADNDEADDNDIAANVVAESDETDDEPQDENHATKVEIEESLDVSADSDDTSEQTDSADADAEASTDPRTNADADAAMGTDAHADAEAVSGSEADADAKAAADAGPETDADAAMGADAHADAHLDAEVDLDTDASLKADTDGSAEADADGTAEAENGSVSADAEEPQASQEAEGDSTAASSRNADSETDEA